jgi:RNA polymerase sigma-70 factor (ECF subfamily)
MTPIELKAEIERLHAAGFAWAMACCGRNRERAEDVLQTSYLKVLDGKARFEGRSSFRTFLFRRHPPHRVRGEAPRPRSARSSSGRRDSRRLRCGGRVGLRRAPRAEVRGRAAPRGGSAKVLHLVFAMGMTLQEAAETLSTLGRGRGEPLSPRQAAARRRAGRGSGRVTSAARRTRARARPAVRGRAPRGRVRGAGTRRAARARPRRRPRAGAISTLALAAALAVLVAAAVLLLRAGALRRGAARGATRRLSSPTGSLRPRSSSTRRDPSS